MTFNVGTIEGGTRAGWRTTKQKGKDWTCAICVTFNRGFLVNCQSCGRGRDGADD